MPSFSCPALIAACQARRFRCVRIFFQWAVGVSASALLFALTAAAQTPPAVDHAFGFDQWFDAPQTEVLDYRYGDSKLPVRAPPSAVAAGAPLMAGSVRGPMARGESLYVKWRDKHTGRVYEDTVDLRGRLPADLTDHRIHFIADGPQLQVYLIALREPRAPGATAAGPRLYRTFNTVQIYPDRPAR